VRLPAHRAKSQTALEGSSGEGRRRFEAFKLPLPCLVLCAVPHMARVFATEQMMRCVSPKLRVLGVVLVVTLLRAIRDRRPRAFRDPRSSDFPQPKLVVACRRRLT